MNAGLQARVRAFPKIIKVMDEEGMLHTTRDVQLLTVEEKNLFWNPDGGAHMSG